MNSYFTARRNPLPDHSLDCPDASPSALRGSIVGSILGILPGGGPMIAQFAAYGLDNKVSKYWHEIDTR